jgi:hypothetical protein
MARTFPSRTLAISIDRPPDEVYSFISNPVNLPRWSFVESVSREGDSWVACSEDGSFGLRFASDNPFGVLDHFVQLAPTVELHVPMRVIPNGEGSEVLFTLLQTEATSEEAFERDVRTVQRDLERLKRVLEAE